VFVPMPQPAAVVMATFQVCSIMLLSKAFTVSLRPGVN